MAARQEIRGIYKDEFDGAKDSKQKLALATRMAKEAVSTQDAVAQFVLSRMAADLAAEGGNLDLSLAIANRLGKDYKCNPMELKAEALGKTAKQIARDRTAFIANQQLVTTSRGLFDDALRANDFDSAESVLKAAGPSAKMLGSLLKNRALSAEIVKKQKEVERLRKRKDLTKKAFDALRADPNNPLANKAAGEWFCFVAGEWEKGSNFLAKSGDAKLTQAAQIEMKKPADAAEQAKLGDLWWDVAEGQEGLEKDRLQERATHWYQEAIPNLSGISRTKIEKRLADIGIVVTPHALQFGSSSTRVEIPNSGYPGGVPITVEAIVNSSYSKAPRPSNPLASSPRISRTIIGNGNGTGVWLGAVYTTSGGSWYFRVGCKVRSSTTGKPVDSSAYSNAGAVAGEWVHLAGVYDGKQVQIYVNGKLVETNKVVGPHVASPFPFVIGACPSKSSSSSRPGVAFGQSFYGKIRGIRISNTARYTKSFDPPKQLKADPDAQLVFQFSEGSGETLKDRSANKLVGNIKGATWVKVEEPKPAEEAAPSKPKAGDGN